MCNLAYDIDRAAEDSNIPRGAIADAIRDRKLTAYRIDGQAFMLPNDYRDWVASHPRF